MEPRYMTSKEEKLDGSNYPLWAFRMRQILQEKDVWQVVREAEDNVSDNEDGSDDEDDVADPLTRTQIKAKKRKALFLLTSSILDIVISRYTSITDPAILWSELKHAYGANTIERRRMLRRQLLTLCFPEGRLMPENFRILGALLSQLGAVGVSPANDELVDIFLDVLPASWDVFRTMIAGRENTPTYMQLENLALAEETKRKARPETTEEVLYANVDWGRGTFTPRGHGCGHIGSRFGRGAGRFTGSIQQQRRGLYHLCGDPSHYARECPTKALEAQIQDLTNRLARLRANKPTVNLAEGDEECTEHFVDADEGAPVEDFGIGQEIKANLTKLGSASEPDWYLDSGASVHLTKEQSALSDFVPFTTQTSVTTAGGNALDIKGKGIVHFDTNKAMDNVLYVPRTRKNLLSVGKITDLGHTVCFNSQACYVVDQNRQIFMHRTRDPRNKLYHLDWSRPPYHSPSTDSLTQLLLPPRL
ncbi:unnamed protein product [Calypogeia fissa]